MASSSVTLLALVAAFGTDAFVWAQDETHDPEWSRFYIGAALGQPRLDRSLSEAGEPLVGLFGDLELDDPTAWKVTAGWRPNRIVGAEIQYVDFNEAAADRYYGAQVDYAGVHARAHADAWVVSTLLFVPERWPSFDVYGKFGVALLDDSFEASGFHYFVPECRPPTVCTYSREQNDSQPHVGIGVRGEITGTVWLSVEYEATDRDIEDPITMLSFGVAWGF